jgi:hypothetical protein
MIMAVILKKNLVSRVANLTVPKGTMVLYSGAMGAIKTGTNSRRSEIWIAAKEKDFTVVGWIRVK